MILDARVHTAKYDYVLDTFRVADSGSGLVEPGYHHDIVTLVEHELAE